MISELAPIVLLLKRGVRPGELLILEEPESHLHPQAQVLLADALYELSRTGVNVILTTHSEFFVAQLSNSIRKSAMEGAEKHENDQYGAFWVQNQEDGSRLVKLAANPEIGIPDDSFAEVSEWLYEQQFSLQRALEKSASE